MRGEATEGRRLRQAAAVRAYNANFLIVLLS